MAASKEEITERAQLVRIHEANCRIEYPTAAELNFRLAVMKALAKGLGLRELRALEITGPVTAAPERPAPGRKPGER
ncbi:MAG TPA: hypothetical protein P5169_08600 [Kiritimatiellia bacterium]|jgi:hypothetical protein|nr:hypothetical protein [Kiritimatiellia bacterium]